VWKGLLRQTKTTMKNLYTLLLLVLPFATFAQAPTKTISGNISADYTFHNDTIYILDGFVFVKNGATLTVEPGTIVKAVKATRSTLIITMGSKINANGTKAQPIVFTSNEAVGNRAPGDWGGIVVLGRNIINRAADCSTCPGVDVAASLPGNQNAIEGDIDNANGDGLYGGTLTDDNSGVLRYVRIEFAGVLITTGNEINSLTMGGVGSGTTLEYIQVFQGNDDSFEWFGGNVSAKYLISTGAIDDDFDTDFGFSGNIQYAIAQRDSFNFDTGSGPTTNSFESDNDGGPTFNDPRTSAVFSNVTLIGPNANGPLEDQGSFQNGLRIRRNSVISLFNSVVMGYPTGMLIDGAGSTNAYLNDTLLIKNNHIAGSLGRNITTNQASSYDAVIAKFVAQGNDTSTTFNGLFNNPFDYLNPDFAPATGSPVLSGASFEGPKISDAFFTPTAFRGALGGENWTECWTEFNAFDEPYTNTINFGPSAAFASTVNDATLTVAFNNSSSTATTYSWNFGDGQTSTDASPSHVYSAIGTYTVSLIANNNCGADTTTSDVTIIEVGIEELANTNNVSLLPNPANEFTQVVFNQKATAVTSIEVLDITGKSVMNAFNGQLNAGQNNIAVNTSTLAPGIYLVRIASEGISLTYRLAVSK
jgi:hypothetical protein